MDNQATIQALAAAMAKHFDADAFFDVVDIDQGMGDEDTYDLIEDALNRQWPDKHYRYSSLDSDDIIDEMDWHYELDGEPNYLDTAEFLLDEFAEADQSPEDYVQQHPREIYDAMFFNPFVRYHVVIDSDVPQLVHDMGTPD